jgi:hypothetical protein
LKTGPTYKEVCLSFADNFSPYALFLFSRFPTHDSNSAKFRYISISFVFHLLGIRKKWARSEAYLLYTAANKVESMMAFSPSQVNNSTFGIAMES